MDVGLQPAGQLHDEGVPVRRGQRHDDQVGTGDLARPVGDQGEDRAARTAGQQAVRDLGRRLEPQLPLLGPLVQAGVVDGHPRRHGEGGQDRLVLGVEVGAAQLLGEVQIAEHLAAYPDRHSQKAVHRRVADGKSVRGPVLREFRQTQGFGVRYQLAQDAVAGRRRADRGGVRVVYADGQELDELPVIGPYDAERAVSRVHQRCRRLHHVPQDLLQVQLTADGHHHFHELLNPVAGAVRRFQSALEEGEPLRALLLLASYLFGAVLGMRHRKHSSGCGRELRTGRCKVPTA